MNSITSLNDFLSLLEDKKTHYILNEMDYDKENPFSLIFSKVQSHFIYQPTRTTNSASLRLFQGENKHAGIMEALYTNPSVVGLSLATKNREEIQSAVLENKKSMIKRSETTSRDTISYPKTSDSERDLSSLKATIGSDRRPVASHLTIDTIPDTTSYLNISTLSPERDYSVFNKYKDVALSNWKQTLALCDEHYSKGQNDLADQEMVAYQNNYFPILHTERILANYFSQSGKNHDDEYRGSNLATEIGLKANTGIKLIDDNFASLIPQVYPMTSGAKHSGSLVYCIARKNDFRNLPQYKTLGIKSPLREYISICGNQPITTKDGRTIDGSSFVKSVRVMAKLGRNNQLEATISKQDVELLKDYFNLLQQESNSNLQKLPPTKSTKKKSPSKGNSINI